MKAVDSRVFEEMVLFVAILSAASGQTAEGLNSGRVAPRNDRTTEFTVADSSIVREIDDPHSGDRWLLLVNALYPGGPGRLVRADLIRGDLPQLKAVERTAPVLLPPLIHPGERVVLEEKSRVVEAHLDAIALNPAAAGGDVRVRLILGGGVVRAVAVGPGRVALDQRELNQKKDGRP